MKDLEQARTFLGAAEKDYRALRGMEDPETFSTEIFGFHVQQAVEKALKAWLCAAGVAFPRIHDLDELGAMLEEAGQEIPDFLHVLLEFTDFAVAFRYEAFPAASKAPSTDPVVSTGLAVCSITSGIS